MIWVELLGWIAAALTLVAYSMRTMLPLRYAAIGANVFFICYSALSGIMPTLVLHVILLPFNIYRLLEILRTLRAAKDARRGAFSLDWIGKLAPPRAFEAGHVLFRKGDPPDRLLYLVEGRVRLVEADITLEAPEIFGEIAFFSDAKERTLTAVCDGPCRIVSIDEATFMRLYYQNPAFGVYVVRLISQRLLDGMERNPGAYLPQVAETAASYRSGAEADGAGLAR